MMNSENIDLFYPIIFCLANSTGFSQHLASSQFCLGLASGFTTVIWHWTQKLEE